jgi:hypothetical protein
MNFKLLCDNRLNTKNHRLTEDLKRNFTGSGVQAKGIPLKKEFMTILSPTCRQQTTTQYDDDYNIQELLGKIQNDDLLDDLKVQIRDLTKTNAQLKNKMLEYKTLAEAGAPKKGVHHHRTKYQQPLVG